MAKPSINNMAVFCDFENVALGVRDARYSRFDIDKVLERLLLKGSIVVKKAYCDWERYKEFKAGMHEASFELIEIPHVRMSGKNSADIRMVVDALDLCYTKAHVDTFVVVSGDSDFSPLVSKLRENNKIVIGVGVKSSTSDLLIANCDEFIYYDDLVRMEEQRRGRRKQAGAARPAKESSRPARGSVPSPVAPSIGNTEAEAGVANGGSGSSAAAMLDAQAGTADETAGGKRHSSRRKSDDERKQEAFDLVLATIEALAEERDVEDKIWGSMIKQALKRQRPGFNESYHGFRSFNQLLEEARARHLIELEKDEKSGGYVVRVASV
jgi:uncharacterized protein (TIGR00288 family)